MVIKIISGGQTGVDRAALDTALELSIEHGGWCPPNRVAEDGIIPEKYNLIETQKERSKYAPNIARSQRTRLNVRDSDATLILLPGSNCVDSGTQWTITCCTELQKEYLLCNPFDELAKTEILNWIRRKKPEVLNIAGPSEGTFPKIYKHTLLLLKSVFSDM